MPAPFPAPSLGRGPCGSATVWPTLSVCRRLSQLVPTPACFAHAMEPDFSASVVLPQPPSWQSIASAPPSNCLPQPVFSQHFLQPLASGPTPASHRGSLLST
eukprot:1140026-Pelagomonas_calceolata.AAC.12